MFKRPISKTTIFVICSLGLSYTNQINAQEISDETIIGRWDLEVTIDDKISPSWLEVYKSGDGTLVGRFVYAFGSASLSLVKLCSLK